MRSVYECKKRPIDHHRFLYDGSNFVQEQNAAGAPTATLTTGGVDQILAE